MTSKNSYFDRALILDRIRKNPWIVALYSVVLFFAMPVFLAIQMQNIGDRIFENKEQYIAQVVSGFFGMDFKFGTFLAIPAAIIAAATVFFYLNSRKQIDFYHSLPIKREKLFVTNYLAGLKFYIIPYTVNLILSIIVLAGMGYISYLSIASAVTGYLFNILLYLVVYSITVFAMVLCGNLVVSLLGTAVFLFYGPLFCVSYTESMRFFYKNFYQLFRLESLMRNTSPVFDFMMSGSRMYTFSAARAIVYIILVALLIGISMYLYRKRPSEAAGRAMAFKISRPLIKYPIVFLCTILFGLFFMSAGNRSMAWMIFGFICGGTISHFIIEIIYHFDFKAIFKNIKGLGIFAVLFAIFISVPAFDLTGYDKRLPEPGTIKSVKLNIIHFNQSSFFANMEDRWEIDYTNYERAQLDKITLSEQGNIGAVLEMAKQGVANTGKAGNDYDASIGVEFELQNGTKIARRYNYLKTKDIEPYIISVFDTPEFKQSFYRLYSIDSKDISQITIQDLYARSGMDSTGQIKDNAKIASIVDALRADTLKLKGQQMKTQVPVMVVNLINGDPKVKVLWEVRVPVYPSFTQTLGVLSTMGIEKPEMIPAEMVDYILVNNYEYEKFMAYSYASEIAMEQRIVEFPKTVAANEVRINDKKEIEQILKSIVPDNTVNYNPFFERDSRYRVNVVSSRYLNGYSESFVFKKDSVPEFIKAKFPGLESAK